MSMHKLVAGDGYRYLTRQVAAGDTGLSATEPLVAYYEATGTPPGRWAGAGLKGLGDERSHLRPGAIVTEAAMAAVFRDGHDPLTHEPLGRSYVGQRKRPVVGFDLTFTVPKSAALLWALGGPRVRAVVEKAHHKAVHQALTYVQKEVVRTRVGAAGRRQISTRGMVAAAFDHYDTRAGDPGLHTHVVLANKVQGPDGKWRSLDGTTVHRATVTVSELYDALFADQLHARLGVTWSHRSRGADRNDAFEVDGIPDPLIRAFSSRAERIHEAELAWAEDFAAKHGRGPSRVETVRARQHLTRTTRPAKVIRSLSELLTEWANRARVLTGLEPADLAARALRGDYSRGLYASAVGPTVRQAFITQTLADAAEHRSVWNTWNLRAAAIRVTKTLRMANADQRVELLDQIVDAAAARCVHLDDTRDPMTRRAGEALFTTAELLAAERVLLDAAESSDYPHPLSGWEADALARSPELEALTPDQADAVTAILCSHRRLDVLVGPAGTGKTTTLAALTTLAREHGRRVIGLAPSASAAHTLREALGIPTETTAKWLYEACGPGAAERARTHDQAVIDRADDSLPWREQRDANQRMWQARAEQDEWRFTLGQLVIVDEASLADTRTLATLVQLADQADAKVVLVGDHLQRGAVGAGGAFGLLARRGPTAELVALHRFAHPWDARASLELRHGRPGALDAYAAHGAIREGDLDTVIDRALDAADTATSRGRVPLLQAADLRTVRELNARARQRAVLAGEATADGVTLPDGFVRNGSLWTVAAIDRDGSLRVRPATPAGPHGSRTGRDGAMRLPAGYVAEHVELGYAVTTARSQGLTVDESHTIATPAMAREDLYVALTRGRHANQLYVALPEPEDCEPDVTGTAQPQLTGRQILDGILATSHAELSATETWAAFHPLDGAHVAPPGREQNQSPRYIARLRETGALATPLFTTPSYTAPTPPPAPVVERPGP